MSVLGGDASFPTPSSRLRLANRGFSWVLGISFLIHLTAICGVVFAQHLRPKRPPPIRAMPVELVRLGKPRDPKLLPRKQPSAEPPPRAAEGVALDAGKEKTPEKQPPPSRREPDLSAAARRLLEGARDNRLDEALGKLEEVEGDPSGSVHGTTSDLANAATGYVATITSALKSNYRLPETIPSSQRQFLKARVVLFIERDGRITRYEFIEQHPEKQFITTLEQLLKSIQLPPPPKELVENLRETGIEVVFKP